MVKRQHARIWLLVMLIMVSACQESTPQGPVQDDAGTVLHIESGAFEAEATIPERYTCNGDDVSPPLSWSELPVGAQSGLTLCFDCFGMAQEVSPRAIPN